MAACGDISVMKELHKLFVRANKLFNGQVEFDYIDELDHDDVNNNQNNDDGAINNENDNSESNNNNGNNDDNNENNNGKTKRIVDFYITPNDGLYKGARIGFRMIINPNTYPQQPPFVECKNEIYHPNIDISGGDYGDYEERGICVNLLSSDWSPQVGLDGTVMAVLFLFYYPQLDDALSTVCTDISWPEYVHNVFLSLRGAVVDEVQFDKLIDDDGTATCPCWNCEKAEATSSESNTCSNGTTENVSTTADNCKVEKENGVEEDTANSALTTENILSNSTVELNPIAGISVSNYATNEIDKTSENLLIMENCDSGEIVLNNTKAMDTSVDIFDNPTIDNKEINGATFVINDNVKENTKPLTELSNCNTQSPNTDIVYVDNHCVLCRGGFQHKTCKIDNISLWCSKLVEWFHGICNSIKFKR